MRFISQSIRPTIPSLLSGFAFAILLVVETGCSGGGGNNVDRNNSPQSQRNARGESATAQDEAIQRELYNQQVSIRDANATPLENSVSQAYNSFPMNSASSTAAAYPVNSKLGGNSNLNAILGTGIALAATLPLVNSGPSDILGGLKSLAGLNKDKGESQPAAQSQTQVASNQNSAAQSASLTLQTEGRPAAASSTSASAPPTLSEIGLTYDLTSPAPVSAASTRPPSPGSASTSAEAKSTASDELCFNLPQNSDDLKKIVDYLKPDHASASTQDQNLGGSSS